MLSYTHYWVRNSNYLSGRKQLAYPFLLSIYGSYCHGYWLYATEQSVLTMEGMRYCAIMNILWSLDKTLMNEVMNYYRRWSQYEEKIILMGVDINKFRVHIYFCRFLYVGRWINDFKHVSEEHF